MRLLLLSDANSVHTQKWAFSLQKYGLNLHVFSLIKPTNASQEKYDRLGISVSSADLERKVRDFRTPNMSKLIYLSAIPQLKKNIKKFEPQLIHAHYASSYGLLGYLTGFHPFVLSTWGSDILDFPNRNRINKWLLKKVIHSADQICSTSKVMAYSISKMTSHNHIKTIPFGVDTQRFIPPAEEAKDFIVGTIKSIEAHNGINCLLDAAHIVIHKFGMDQIKFIIVGKGTHKDQMVEKCKKLNLENHVQFAGHAPHEFIVDWFQRLSIFIAVSTRESFGVSILEAAACGIPAITSNVGGLPEVNKHDETGIVIPSESPDELAEKIIYLYKNNQLRLKLGNNARRRVVSDFNWDKSVSQMLKIYDKLCP